MKNATLVIVFFFNPVREYTLETIDLYYCPTLEFTNKYEIMNNLRKLEE